MARPQTKQEILTQSNEDFVALLTMIEELSTLEKETPFDFTGQPSKKEAHWQRDKNTRDVLAHLLEWQQLLIRWLEDNQQGRTRLFLPAPYTWKNYAKMNQAIWEECQEVSFEEVKEKLEGTHQQTMALIERLPEEALLTKSYFTWTGTTSVASYCTSSTTSHYQWAMKKIKAHKRSVKKANDFV